MLRSSVPPSAPALGPSAPAAAPLLAHRTLSSAIVEQLRQSILGGRRAAGSQLRQDSLAAEFGVSRIPVREALFQLEAEGLVRIEPHKGAVVAGFALPEIDDVFDLRVLLEPRLLAQSMPRLTAADYAEITGLDTAFAEAITRQDVARWGELNAQLHLSLYRHAALPRTLAIVTALLQSSDRYTRVQMNREAALARAQREHRKLIALCRAGQVDQACRYLVAHIEAVRQDLHRLLAPEGGKPAATATAPTAHKTSTATTTNVAQRTQSAKPAKTAKTGRATQTARTTKATKNMQKTVAAHVARPPRAGRKVPR